MEQKREVASEVAYSSLKFFIVCDTFSKGITTKQGTNIFKAGTKNGTR